ncbi:MAG: threonine--tRNA ligase [Pseudomonadota bacterium]
MCQQLSARQPNIDTDEQWRQHMDNHDHRMIANRMDLFHQQEEGPGMAFWHPRGFALYRIVEDYMRRRMRRLGFHEVRTPQLLARALWDKSGHWEKFGENMFTFEDGERSAALKPMSCPGHVQIFNKRRRSFRDLPMRLCEFGACHRNEPSGALQGLMRGRSFVQDDAHIFCAEEQVEPEIVRFCNQLLEIYLDFGFDQVRVAFSTRPERRAGSDAAWDRAESMIEDAAKAAGLDYQVDPGEGAFYGPKLDFHLRDSRGREWQCGTVQLDLVLPGRLDALYVSAANEQVRPVMIHHAVLGSLERFVGILLEHYDGNLPLWLAPEQMVVAAIGEAQNVYAEQVASRFEEAGYRATADTRAERLSRKIVDAREAGTPILMAVGNREQASDQVAIRQRDGHQESQTVDEAIAALRGEAFRY